MLARELISPIIPALHPRDTGDKALRLMNEYHLAHLPLVEETRYLGLVEEAALLDWEDAGQLLQTLEGQYLRPAVLADSHLLEVFRLVGDFKLSAIPVVTEADEYEGVITLDNMIYAWARLDEVREPGGILVLEAEARDFNLAEITRLAESNDIGILGIHTYSDPEQHHMCVLIKTNRLDLYDFAATLEHFRYQVRYQFGHHSSEETLRKNYDLLMNYIGM
ncbi:CBS domain-containing protein [Compostibacter hankyongensis]|uniref:Acetoin utilization AcuB family protein n=1 Tax=Compostibacter hankyongensis TaxID=1007089 RepID=A0ABP8FTI3_9BACT